MSERWQNNQRRLLDLLADRATFGLGPDQEWELRQLLRIMPEFDVECMERAAATVQLAAASVEPLPSVVREKIRARGARCLRSQRNA